MDVDFEVKESEIHGNGVFSIREMKDSERVGIVVERVSNRLKVTNDLGIFVNHSESPNCKLFMVLDSVIMKTIREVKKGEELVADYNDEENPWFVARAEFK